MTGSTTVLEGDSAVELVYEIERVYYDGGRGFRFEPELQRAYMPKKAMDIARDFDVNALGVLHLSERADGDRIGLDGQHRVMAGEIVRHDGYVAKVYRGLTVEQEAQLFRQLNNTSKVGTLDLFRVALREGRGAERLVQRIVEDAGFSTLPGHTNSFTAVKTALRIVERKNGDEHLRWALKVAAGAWGHTAEAVSGPIVEGLAMVKARHRDNLDTDNMIKKLTGRAGRAPGLLGDARTLQRSYGGSVKSNVCEVLMTAYNTGLRKYKLPDWRTSEAAAKAAEAGTEPTEAVPAEEAKREPMIKVQVVAPSKPTPGTIWKPGPPKFSGSQGGGGRG
jgi:hypothetical protein